MEEEGLDEVAAGNAVLQDNLFGLELDPRCIQIAAFALAFAAWKSGGYRDIPLPNVACSGIAVTGELDDWKKLAKGDGRLADGLERLYHLFKQAPTLGSLIDPERDPDPGSDVHAGLRRDRAAASGGAGAVSDAERSRGGRLW